MIELLNIAAALRKIESQQNRLAHAQALSDHWTCARTHLIAMMLTIPPKDRLAELEILIDGMSDELEDTCVQAVARIEPIEKAVADKTIEWADGMKRIQEIADRRPQDEADAYQKKVKGHA